MKTFHDNTGRRWAVVINVSTVRRVRELAGVDLLQMSGRQLVERLAGDPVLLCDVLYAICRPQAQADGVTDEQFGEAMAGDAIDEATTALLDEVALFYPGRRRELLQKANAKLRAMQEKVLDAAEAQLDDPELDRLLEQAIADAARPTGPIPKTLGRPSPDARPSPA